IQTTTATVRPDASVGRHDVVVTNPDSSTSQCSGCLYVGHLPGAPGLATLTPGDGQVDLTWHPSTSDEPTSLDYLIQVRTIDDQAISDSGTSAPFFTASGLTNGTEYRIEVTPRDAFGYGEPLHVTARPGRAPEQPVLSSAPAPDMVHID